MSNFGQGFPNANFNPALLYNLGGNAAAGVGGVGDVTQPQQQAFNLNNLGQLGANAGNLPADWLSSFNNMQAQASHQLNQPQQQQQQPGTNNAAGQPNNGMPRGGMPSNEQVVSHTSRLVG
jgi:hypothetical protein